MLIEHKGLVSARGDKHCSAALLRALTRKGVIVKPDEQYPSPPTKSIKPLQQSRKCQRVLLLTTKAILPA